MKDSREIRTWRVGQIGMMGTRRVLEGGVIEICKKRYYADTLLKYVGEIIMFHDDDERPLWRDGKWIGSVYVTLPWWHANGRVSMTSEPYLGRAYTEPRQFTHQHAEAT